MRLGTLVAALLLSAPALPLAAHAQQWPTRLITIISPYPPGGTNDIVGRLFAEKLAVKLGQPIIVDNRPGAAGIVGSLAASRAEPDGYTLLMANNGALVVQPLVSSQAKYDAVTSFTPIVRLAVAYQFVGVNADLPAKSMLDLVELAKKQPGKLNYGSAGTGSFGHFSGEMLRILTGAQMQHVPYRGSAAAVTDLAGGQIQAMFDPLVLTQKDGGRVRVLGTTAPQRLSRYPDVPTMAEAGLPDYDPAGWFGFFGPPGLPKEIAQKIAEAAAEFARQPDTIEKLEVAGLATGTMLPDEFAAFIKTYKVKYEDIKRRANIETAQ
jgi:tripartite-type tricarboxylate transporter receptor subunit TctC